MKKIKYILFLILFVVFVPNVYASSVSTYVSGPSSTYPDNNIKVNIGVSNAPLLYGFTGNISYDSSKLKLKSSSGLSGFSVLLGSNLTADSASGKKGSYSFLELNFVPTSNFNAGEKTVISFTNVETSDGNDTLGCSNSSLTITMKAPKSKNNYLSNLIIDQGDILFDKKKDTYSIVVDNDVTKIVIEATAEDKKSKVTGTGTKLLNVYENVFNIVVKAESGAKKTYTIVVTRKDEDGKTTKPKSKTATPTSIEEKIVLDGLKIDGYELDFKSDVYNYSLKVNDLDTKLNVIPIYDKNKFTCETSNPEELIVGENLIKITVKDKNNKSVVYSIKVIKNEIIKQDTFDNDVCKCVSNKCNYKYIFYFENLLLLLGTVVFLIIKKVNKKKYKLNY